MERHVSWLLEVAVKPGQLDTFRVLMNELVESTRAEPGAEIYEWFVDDGGGVVHLHERHTDLAAALAHLGMFGEVFAGRFLVAAEPTRFTVMGSPNDEAKAAPGGVPAAVRWPRAVRRHMRRATAPMLAGCAVRGACRLPLGTAADVPGATECELTRGLSWTG